MLLDQINELTSIKKYSVIPFDYIYEYEFKKHFISFDFFFVGWTLDYTLYSRVVNNASYVFTHYNKCDISSNI